MGEGAGRKYIIRKPPSVATPTIIGGMMIWVFVIFRRGLSSLSFRFGVVSSPLSNYALVSYLVQLLKS
jgi:hypothetical protein